MINKIKKSNSKNCFIKESKRIFILLLSLIVLFFTQNYAFADNYTKIPKRVIKFANKHHCTDLKKHTSFDRPFYGYKGYDVYIGNTIFEGEKEDCIILYKYGIVRFAKPKEYPQIFFLEAPPLPIGLWWQYWHEHRKYMYHIPLRKLLFG